jgi:hypothetical protein
MFQKFASRFQVGVTAILLLSASLGGSAALAVEAAAPPTQSGYDVGKDCRTRPNESFDTCIRGGCAALHRDLGPLYEQCLEKARTIQKTEETDTPGEDVPAPSDPAE